MAFRKILCPVDFSAGSEAALQYAVHQATRDGAELVLAHAYYVPPSVYAGELPFPADVADRLIADCEAGLARAEAQARQLGAERVSTTLLMGPPADQIAEALTEDEAFDLVILGTHGRSGLSRVLLGSVAESVVRHSPCTTMVVHEADPVTPVRHVLVPVDFQEHSKLAIGLAKQLLETRGTITLLHVVEIPLAYSGAPPMAQFVADVEERAAQVLEQWARDARVGFEGEVQTRQRIGQPGSKALDLLHDEPVFDAVVVGSHGRTGLRRVLLGSVAEKIVRHADRPVIVARER